MRLRCHAKPRVLRSQQKVMEVSKITSKNNLEKVFDTISYLARMTVRFEMNFTVTQSRSLKI
jgi:hypothetical protein